MNLSDLQGETSRLLGEGASGPSRWPLATLTPRINIAQQVIQGQTNAVKTTESVVVTSGVATVSLNANTMDVIRVYKVYSDNTMRPLTGRTSERMDFEFPDWKQWQAGEPIYFIYDATTQKITLAPTPDTSIASLSVVESRKPADLVNSTDIPFDSNNQMTPYHITICHWVTAQCFLDDGSAEGFTKSQRHRSDNMIKPGIFERNIGRIQAEFDVPEAVPDRVLWKPQGGRLGYVYYPSKSSPFLW